MDPPHLAIHTAFDALAWVAAAGLAWFLTKRARIAFPVAQAQRASYYAALVLGSGLGAYVFGTLNLWACGRSGFARSIEGAILGGVVAVEGYKAFAGISTRTGARFAAPLAIGVAVGRIGCFFAGIGDFTYGVPTNLPWGHDFGDGVMRHPVPLYESAAMTAFLIFYLTAALRDVRWVIDNGLYLAILFYAVQRFVWESFKPYAPVAGPLTIFQLLSLLLAAYGAAMLLSAKGKPDERSVLA